MSNRRRSSLSALVALFAVALPIAASQAAAGRDTIRIRYSDLNLSTTAGVETLYDRIRTAAADYCEPARLLTGTRVSPGYARCVKDAVATTVRQIGNPGLTALHVSRSGAIPG
jgi:UrcA family protein